MSASSPDANATARIRQLAGLDTGSRYENEAEDPDTITSAPRPITGAASRGSSDRGEDDAEEAAAEARELLASWMRIDEQAARIREEKKRDADVQERIAADRRFDGVQKSSVVQRPVPFEHTLRQDSSLSTVGRTKRAEMLQLAGVKQPDCDAPSSLSKPSRTKEPADEKRGKLRRRPSDTGGENGVGTVEDGVTICSISREERRLRLKNQTQLRGRAGDPAMMMEARQAPIRAKREERRARQLENERAQRHMTPE